jgi:hypothetical protein
MTARIAAAQAPSAVPDKSALETGGIPAIE